MPVLMVLAAVTVLLVDQAIGRSGFAERRRCRDGLAVVRQTREEVDA